VENPLRHQQVAATRGVKGGILSSRSVHLESVFLQSHEEDIDEAVVGA
jgi:hypothetical protein